MNNNQLISRLWQEIAGLDADILNANWLTLGNFYGCETILGLSPLPNIKPADIPDISILSMKPAFKNLDIQGIHYLRASVQIDKLTPELRAWAETIMRFLEINLTTLKAKCKRKFGSVLSGIPVLLEMTAFLMDCHFAWKDLRYLNIVLKLMDLNWLYSFNGSVKLMPSQKDSMQINLLQLRLLIMRQAALKKIDYGLPDA